MAARSPGEPLKLLFVINAPIVGGAERHTLDLADALSQRGCRCTIFAIKNGPVQPHGQVTLLQPDAPRRLAARIDDLRRVIKREQPDILVSVNERPVLVVGLARWAARATCPLIAVVHSTVLRTVRQKMFRALYLPFFRRAASVVFVSANQRSYWAKGGFVPRHGETIVNGVDTGSFAPAIRDVLRPASRLRHGFSDDDLVLGLCAVMRPEKNHLQLVDLVARLRSLGVPARALLVGDGPCRGAIVDRARALGIAGQVVLAGMAGDVRPDVAAFDIGVLCSVAIETLSLAALEIMAMGVPMVLSDLGGASEIVDGTNGRLFAVGDDEQLRSAVLALRAPETRHDAGAAARTRVVERFDRSTMVERYHRHFASIAGRPSPAIEREPPAPLTGTP